MPGSLQRMVRPQSRHLTLFVLRAVTANTAPPTPNAAAKNADKKKFQWSTRRQTYIVLG
jgi:hypothetical protein